MYAILWTPKGPPGKDGGTSRHIRFCPNHRSDYIPEVLGGEGRRHMSFQYRTQPGTLIRTFRGMFPCDITHSQARRPCSRAPVQ